MDNENSKKKLISGTRINQAMKECHGALLDAGWFTAQQAHRIIQNTMNLKDVKDAENLFATMRVMGWIVESMDRGFIAAPPRSADDADSLKDAWEALFVTLDERGLPFDTVAFRAACDTARDLIAKFRERRSHV